MTHRVLQVIAALSLSGAALVSAEAGRRLSTPGTPRLVAPDVRFLNESGRFQPGRRCGAPEVSAAEAALVAEQLVRFKDVFGKAAPLARPIPVAVHVVYRKRGKREIGNVSDERIEEQVEVLNRSFAGTGIRFRLASVDRTRNRKWFTKCASGAERKMKRKLAVDPANTLNLYTCKPRGGTLGLARFPWEAEPASSRHGVIVRHSALPGGGAAPYNLGNTAVHEVGHYLGLLHTFHGGCGEPGDSVADTSAELYPAFGCPIGRDTCIGGGADPVFNYMDYSDDACMDRFSVGQVERIREMVRVFRPSL